MAADYKLDDEGDLDLSQAAYEFVEDAEQIKQSLGIALQIDQGEWFENVDAGVPWLNTILSQRDTKDFMDAFLTSYISNFLGITTLEEYDSVISQEGEAQINFKAILDGGEEIILQTEV